PLFTPMKGKDFRSNSNLFFSNSEKDKPAQSCELPQNKIVTQSDQASQPTSLSFTGPSQDISGVEETSVPDYQLGRGIAALFLSINATLFLCWNPEEAAKYIEAFKKLENQSPDSIMERGTEVGEDGAYVAQLTDALTKLRSINKTDVLTLATNFPNFKSLAQATPEQLSLCPGLGEKKVCCLYNILIFR
ncbi:ssDNA endonuclease and repair protein rad10, partial [Massospora cicadina]